MNRYFLTAAALVLTTSLVFADEISDKNSALVKAIETQKMSANEAGILSLDSIAEELFTTGTANVIVTLRQASAFSTMQADDWSNPVQREALQAANIAIADTVLARVGKRVKADLQYQNFAGFSAKVDAEGLEALKNDPDVLCIQPDVARFPHTKQGIPLMQAQDFTRGLSSHPKYDGTGVSIAICDTGVDYNHPQLGNGGFPNSKVIGGYNTGDKKDDPAPQGQPHGTECAGTAAGDIPPDGTYAAGDFQGGVAPGAKIYALKISYGQTGQANDSAIYKAWDWCVTNKNKDANNPLLVISTSFGGGQYSTNTDVMDPAGALSANSAVSAGITLFVSSGNDGFCDAVASPSSLSSAISVGAVYDADIGTVGFTLTSASCLGAGDKYEATHADKVTCYSNASATLLGILAPSHNNATTGLGGSYSSEFGGTSAACPYAAGAAVALQCASKSLLGRWLTPSEVRSKLITTGDNVTDTKVAVTKPRVNLENAVNSMLPPAQLTVNILPAEAAALTEAQWSFAGSEWKNSGQTVSIPKHGTYALSFLPISGWQVPAGKSVTVNSGEIKTINVTYTTAAPGPDMALTAADFTNGVTSSLQPGSPINMRWSVASTDTFDTPFWCEVFASKTGGFDQVRFGSTVTNSYVQNGLTNKICNIDPGNQVLKTLPDGVYSMMPVVNRYAAKTFDEAAYSNNWMTIAGKRLRVRSQAAATADLLIKDATFTINPTNPEAITVTGTIRNVGRTANAECWLEVFCGNLSMESTLDPIKTIAPGTLIPVLAPNAETTFTQLGWVQEGAAKYAYAAIADSTDIVPESNEVNNSSLWAPAGVVPTPPQTNVDLAITTMTLFNSQLAPNQVSPGDQLNCMVIVRNNGTTNVDGAWLEIFASQDGGVSFTRGSGIIDGKYIVPPAPGTETYYLLFDVLPIKAIGDGMYTLVAVVNRNGVPGNPGDKKPEDNRLKFPTGRISLNTPASDEGTVNLIWASGPVFQQNGNTVTVTGTVKNAGSLKSAAFWTEAFSGELDPKMGFFTRNTSVFAGGVLCEGLGPNAEFNVNISGTAVPGKVLGVLTDSTDLIPESDETDNYGYSTPMQ